PLPRGDLHRDRDHGRRRGERPEPHPDGPFQGAGPRRGGVPGGRGQVGDGRGRTVPEAPSPVEGPPPPAARRRRDGGQPGPRTRRDRGVDGLTSSLAALFQFNVWSFAVPAAIFFGYWLALVRARQAGLDTQRFESSMEWGIGGGLLLSHVAEIVLYQPQKLKAEGPLELLKFWDGLS